MLKVSSIKALKHKHLPSFFARKYNYQKEIYTNKFEIREDRDLKDQLAKINSHINAQPNLFRFVNSYRQNGFRVANLDPLNQEKQSVELQALDPKTYGLDLKDEKLYDTTGIIFNSSNQRMTIKQIEDYLKDTYSSNLTIEFDYIQNEEEKLWISKEFEKLKTLNLESKTKIELLKLLSKSEVKFITLIYNQTN
jgi:2-oxoglutarate dehydrogenase complex dehydrogenase (E1) component-like enzyme